MEEHTYIASCADLNKSVIVIGISGDVTGR